MIHEELDVSEILNVGGGEYDGFGNSHVSKARPFDSTQGWLLGTSDSINVRLALDLLERGCKCERAPGPRETLRRRRDGRLVFLITVPIDRAL